MYDWDKLIGCTGFLEVLGGLIIKGNRVEINMLMFGEGPKLADLGYNIMLIQTNNRFIFFKGWGRRLAEWREVCYIFFVVRLHMC